MREAGGPDGLLAALQQPRLLHLQHRDVVLKDCDVERVEQEPTLLLRILFVPFALLLLHFYLSNPGIMVRRTVIDTRTIVSPCDVAGVAGVDDDLADCQPHLTAVQRGGAAARQLVRTQPQSQLAWFGVPGQGACHQHRSSCEMLILESKHQIKYLL